MEVSALDTAPSLRGPSTLLRLQSDERLVTLTRRGNQAAYEVLVQRYQSRLLAFCRHMLSSREDAEDVLQEVFANAFNAILGDDRAINVRPWLYRIARNRCLNHLRKIQPIGVDTLDDRIADNGTSAADTAHKREEFRELLGDVRALPETQRTALLLREIDALSYDQIAEAMDTTVPSVKSLLVRARVALAEASEARNLTCEEVREELGEVSESLKRVSPPVRRHLKECERCATFQTHLKANNRAMQALFPLGPLVVVKKLLAHATAGAGASGGAAVSGAAASSVAGGLITTGVSTIATKTAAGLAAAAIFTAGAVEVDHARNQSVATGQPQALLAEAHEAAPAAPPEVRVAPTPSAPPERAAAAVPAATTERTTTTTDARPRRTTTAVTPVPPAATTAPATPVPPAAAPSSPTTTTTAPPVDSGSQTVTLPATPPTATGTPTTGAPPAGTTTPKAPAPKAPAPSTATPAPPAPTPGAAGPMTVTTVAGTPAP
ncbi:RNA polymerase sigma factor [Patulibacter brassicae]|uniref:RNA polymerase sigma factor n=1 Tax=Patulibacter brassicae TaxID=1705717 RepID=A0ABU4VHD6_9ACTN|nr:RNA polymerase sigma factor [Patulibacter brassicae]MDX8151237.1 RNA polymerase sigma factor [Patulibacter brassicae]